MYYQFTLIQFYNLLFKRYTASIFYSDINEEFLSPSFATKGRDARFTYIPAVSVLELVYHFQILKS
ncbi:MAG: hypothetical protein BGN92_01775 [Sphingobacteriales bacterium 41-5]|nr:MAG: hypothetical protein BGN92_01775 [Sphingobacteriales bacterium 41-5]